jgi:hypothetical protein
VDDDVGAVHNPRNTLAKVITTMEEDEEEEGQNDDEEEDDAGQELEDGQEEDELAEYELATRNSKDNKKLYSFALLF